MKGLHVARLGLARGGIELRQLFTYWQDLAPSLVLPAIQIVVLLVMRGHHVPGTSFSLGSLTLPSVIGMSFAFGGLLGVVGLLVVDKDDGVLLRAKATPDGMTAYVIGKITVASATTLIGLVITLVIGLAAFPGVRVTVPGLATLTWVAVLGLLATIPLGITLGSLLPNPRYLPLVMLPFGGISAVSGIFYPITHLAGWLQAIGQLFPMYWLGLGMRAALLPPHLASVEIDGSWRLPQVFLALALWSLLGLATAPPVLRRMARRESGARVAERRERAILRRA
ncbi:MAG TPA: ABC transporter permease [Trebonia sp.]|nr:ABC transporter permease [Trebonia sp.]